VRAAHDRAVGADVSSSLVSVVCRLVLFTSTTGDSPATVTVSVTAPTCSSALIVAVNVPVNSMLSRLTEVNPGSEKLNE